MSVSFRVLLSRWLIAKNTNLQAFKEQFIFLVLSLKVKGKNGLGSKIFSNVFALPKRPISEKYKMNPGYEIRIWSIICENYFQTWWH